MIPLDSIFKIGKLGRAHGLKGEIVFFCDDDVFDRAGAEYLVLMIDGIPVPFFMEGYRFQTDDRALVKFEGMDTVEDVAELVGKEVYFPKEAAKEAAGEFSPASLVGFSIYDTVSGVTTAPVSRVSTETDNTLFELSDGKLVPVAEDWIKEIDREGKIIRMSLPEGLLTL